jgi:hypothetical protein
MLGGSVEAFLFVRRLNRLIIFCCVYDAFYHVLNSCVKRRDPVVCVIYGLLWYIATGGLLPLIS